MNDQQNRDGGVDDATSDAGEEDPGAAEGDPAMQRALQGEAAAVRQHETERTATERTATEGTATGKPAADEPPARSPERT